MTGHGMILVHTDRFGALLVAYVKGFCAPGVKTASRRRVHRAGHIPLDPDVVNSIMCCDKYIIGEVPVSKPGGYPR